MKRAVYQVAIGDSPLYTVCTQSVARWCEKHGVEHVVQTEPILKIRPGPGNQRSPQATKPHGCLVIFEKENAFALLDEYDQVAVIDADVYVKPGAPNLFDRVSDWYHFAACIERNMPITSQYLAKLRDYSLRQYWNLTDVDWDWEESSGARFFNMGMLVLNKRFSELLDGQTPSEFLARPYFQRFIDGEGAWRWSTDQTLLNWFLQRSIGRALDLHWKWNALYGAVFPEHIRQAHFVHFFLSKHIRGLNEGPIDEKVINRLLTRRS
jgi:lipopolysaccharide biosynthesis glycosyltransferase